MVPTFRGARDFFGPLNGTSDSEGRFGAKIVCTVLHCTVPYCTVNVHRCIVYNLDAHISTRVGAPSGLKNCHGPKISGGLAQKINLNASLPSF